MVNHKKLNKKDIIQRYIIEAINDFYEKDANGNIINDTEMPDNDFLDQAVRKKLQDADDISPVLKDKTFAQLKAISNAYGENFKKFNKARKDKKLPTLSKEKYDQYLIDNGRGYVLDAVKMYDKVNQHAASNSKEKEIISPAREKATQQLQKTFGSKSIPMDSDYWNGNGKLTKSDRALYAYDFTTKNRKIKTGGVDDQGRPIADVTTYIDTKSKQKSFVTPEDKKRAFEAIKQALNLKSDEECNKLLISKGRYDLLPNEDLIPKKSKNKQKDFVKDDLNKINVQIKKNDISKVESELSKYGFDVALTGKIFSYGNTKLPPSTLIINLTSATACPSGKEINGGLPECPFYGTFCYAHKGERMYGNEFQRNTRNDVLLRKLEPQQFAKLLHAYLMAAPYRITDIRISENGDIEDQETLNWCEDLAGYVRKRYGINTATYTHKAIDSKTFKPLDFSNIHNLVINSSHDKKYLYGDKMINNPYYKYMVGTTRNYLVLTDKNEFNSLRMGYDKKPVNINERNSILERYLSSEKGYVKDVSSEERNNVYQKIVQKQLLEKEQWDLSLNESTNDLLEYSDVVKYTPLTFENGTWMCKYIRERQTENGSERYWRCCCDCSICRFCYNTKAQNFELYDDPQERTNTYCLVH